ncbi:MAG: indolepyruvate ferredoxin oxidoreductase subunit alpha [Gemmatimonadota bacterium]|nr:MAG: indolepyruvate ferredoxin oxidoreductase subunit alpha [Gemmatimonadota bacterium]
MSGNEAIARGAWEAGVLFAAGYPGTPSTEVLEALSTYHDVDAQWSTNEKVAFDECIGAALGGARSMVTMKHVGLNVAADPFMVFPYGGTNAGFVALVADDPGMYSSQNEQDSRYFAKIAKVPLLEPSDAREAHEFVKFAFELSERFETPVMFRTTTRLAHTRSVVESAERMDAPRRPFSRKISQYAIPVYARFRRPELEDKLNRLREFAEEYPGNVVEEGSRDIGIVTHGIPYQYVKEVAPGASVFKLGMIYPLPKRRLEQFCARFEMVFVVEESEGFIEQEMASFGILNVIGKERFTNIGELSADLVAQGLNSTSVPSDFAAQTTILPRPPVLCPGCSHRGVLGALKELGVLVTGDIGCYTLGCLPPYEAMHTTFCMGASIGNATGFNKAGEERVVGLIGDSTFLHSGLPSLLSAVYNQVPTTTILLDNGTTGMTGHQQHPGTGSTLKERPAPRVNYENLIQSLGVEHVAVVDPWDPEATAAAIKSGLDHPGPAVIIARRSCRLLPEEKAKDKVPYQVEELNCIQCEDCMATGCPALVWEGDTPHIREWECAGCAMCAYLCPVDAICQVEVSVDANH